MKPTLSVRRRQGGALLVEFSLLMPIAMLVVLLILEVLRFHAATILLDRALYQIAYELRIARGNNLPAITRDVLDQGNYLLFDPEKVQIIATHASSAGGIAQGGSGTGQPGDIVQLQLYADVGMLSALAGVFGMKSGKDAEQRSRDIQLTLIGITEPDQY